MEIDDTVVDAEVDGAPEVPPKKPAKKFKFRGKYPQGGPKIIRAELEKQGLVYCPPNTPDGTPIAFGALQRLCVLMFLPAALCDVIWAMRVEKADWKSLKYWQKISFIPAMPEICWKHNLHLNLERFKAQFGADVAPFWPRGYVLPQDIDAVRETLRVAAAAQELCPIILKPSLSAMGSGIECVTNEEQLDKYLAKDRVTFPVNNPSPSKDIILAQHYVLNPLLLDGFKISFRIYVLVTSFAPLRAFVYPRGLTRISSKRYTTDPASFESLYVHLTNVDINKYNIDEFLATVSKEVKTDGLRSDVEYIFGRLKDEGRDVDAIWNNMKDAICKSLLSVEHKIGTFVSQMVPSRNMVFEILGYDFLLDTDMQPWLLEINHGPNLEPHTDLENDIKACMIRDSLHVVDVLRKDTVRVSQETDRLWAILQARLESGEEVPDLGGVPAKSLTRGDIYHLIDAEWELDRRASYEPLFHLGNSEFYSQYVNPASRATSLAFKIWASGVSVFSWLE